MILHYFTLPILPCVYGPSRAALQNAAMHVASSMLPQEKIERADNRFDSISPNQVLTNAVHCAAARGC